MLRHVPIINALLYFPKETHKKSIKKFFILWVFSSLPIIAAVIFSPVPEGDIGILPKLILKLKDGISNTEQFVYAASFLSPVIYIAISRYFSNSGGAGDRVVKVTSSVFDGYTFIFIASFLVLLFTGMAFAVAKVDADSFQNTFFHAAIYKFPYIVYLYALACWYISILDSEFEYNVYSGEYDKSDKNVAADFSSRLDSRGGEK